jgi:hypothetical protein
VIEEWDNILTKEGEADRKVKKAAL